MVAVLTRATLRGQGRGLDRCAGLLGKSPGSWAGGDKIGAQRAKLERLERNAQVCERAGDTARHVKANEQPPQKIHPEPVAEDRANVQRLSSGLTLANSSA
jgi:hypothetical protein